MISTETMKQHTLHHSPPHFGLPPPLPCAPPSPSPPPPCTPHPPPSTSGYHSSTCHTDDYTCGCQQSHYSALWEGKARRIEGPSQRQDEEEGHGEIVVGSNQTLQCTSCTSPCCKHVGLEGWLKRQHFSRSAGEPERTEVVQNLKNFPLVRWNDGSLFLCALALGSIAVVSGTLW